ncbi:unannotated protein [freshwater metagenome]|uniref:Unannotated protein n=1 Tax=freshwater metagenome TaxID=449393 RepID=A0A6J7XS65_9ZZZZ|nr:lysozyme M1 (1,4-beta-N-acetylmuramidase) [Actinomycetota bacterium]
MKIRIFLFSFTLFFISAVPANANDIGDVPVITDASPITTVDLQGPGARIHGADISRWQHPNGRSIDFAKMYQAGIRFVMIKASDTRDDADALSYKYLKLDRTAAQAAGIFTGFYHYTVLPDVTTPNEIRLDALAQAQKVVWRLAAIGGFTSRDLPYALDLENKCTRLRTSGTCAKYATSSAVTLWAETFLKSVAEKTGRTPIMYSYSNFLESSMKRSAELAKYPLWVAHYAVDPAIANAQPGQKKPGCYVHSWTSSQCQTQWTMWQYTSCGLAPRYGVPGTRLDLNVFGGTPSAFAQLLTGTWIPSSGDLMPSNEPSSMAIKSVTFSKSNKPLVVSVDVSRPDSTPVVTGSIKLVVDPLTPIAPKPVQKVVRDTSGSWTLTVKGIPAGTWNANIVYTDQSGTHAQSLSPVSFTIEQSVIPTPTAIPSPTPTVKPSPKPTKKATTNGCKNQIRN